jgi:hypothetical protein
MMLLRSRFDRLRSLRRSFVSPPGGLEVLCAPSKKPAIVQIVSPLAGVAWDFVTESRPP